jgi:hypothetical protein
MMRQQSAWKTIVSRRGRSKIRETTAGATNAGFRDGVLCMLRAVVDGKRLALNHLFRGRGQGLPCDITKLSSSNLLI